MKKKKINLKLIQFIAAYVLVTMGMTLMAIAMFLPPVGIIHPTVLAAFGEVGTWAGTIMGMDYSYRKSNRNHHQEE